MQKWKAKFNMGIKDKIREIGGQAADVVSKLSSLSPEQISRVMVQREMYLNEIPDPSDQSADEFTKRLIAAAGVEIYQAYLSQLKDIYSPVESSYEYSGRPFDSKHNVRFLNITKWVVDKNENSLEKLVNVYQVLKSEECNIALVFHRTQKLTNVYLAVINTKNADNNNDVENYKKRIIGAIRGNFPGAEWDLNYGGGFIPGLNIEKSYSVAIASNIPAEKSEKFNVQTIEKLLDGVVPDSPEEEYLLILLATPILDVESQKLNLSQYYSGLYPYSNWTTNYQYNEQSGTSSSATVSVNIGAGAGLQGGNNLNMTTSEGSTDSVNYSQSQNIGRSVTDNINQTVSESSTDSFNSSMAFNETQGQSVSQSLSQSQTISFGETATVAYSQDQSFNVGVNASANLPKVNAGINVGYSNSGGSSYSEGISSSVSDSMASSSSESISSSQGTTRSSSIGKAIATTVGTSAGRAIVSSVANTVSNGLGKAITNSSAMTVGTNRGVNFGVNFGAGFARSSNVTATIGKSEGITQNFINFNIKHALDLLTKQMERFDESAALGMWDFAAYVISEDHNIASNVAHSYLALTQGNESYLSTGSVNVWRGDLEESEESAKEICKYLFELRHPIFGLSPNIVTEDSTYFVYPSVVRATTSLSGHELAYSLNFPKKSVVGLPVIECAEFGRNIICYNTANDQERTIHLGHIFHMNHTESTDVDISLDSLDSHAFITGSTGSGKSNTIYKILLEAHAHNIPFLVIEPAKGEYKRLFGQYTDVSVFGTNPKLTPLLRINPFSFPSEIHVLEHLDRIVEIFNVCWPMYAAMPAVLKNAIEQSYKNCGWDLLTSTNSLSETLFPTFIDVARNIKLIIESSEYDVENKGAYKGSLLTRLTSLTTGINGLIFGSDEISDADLFDCNVIVDLSRVGSNETKSLIMGLLVLKLQEYRIAKTNGMNVSLHHLTVLEEAHNLLRRVDFSANLDGGNLAGKSVEMLSNSIAEMRTYGEGFIITDQAPGLLDLSVIRNTNTKIILRLPDLDDRLLVGKSANLNDDQIQELAKLPRGVAAIYQNDWILPVLCSVDKANIADESEYSYTPDEEVTLNIGDDNVISSLAEKIANYGFNRLNENVDLIDMKQKVLKANISDVIKKDYLNLIFNSEGSYTEKLKHLLYETFNAEAAFELAKQSQTFDSWNESFRKSLFPSLEKFSKQDTDLLVALLLSEQSRRNHNYENLYLYYVERFFLNERVM